MVIPLPESRFSQNCFINKVYEQGKSINTKHRKPEFRSKMNFNSNCQHWLQNYEIRMGESKTTFILVQSLRGPTSSYTQQI